LNGFTSLLLVLSACSTSNGLEYPITERKYKDDTVNVQVAVNLAYSAYLSGCVDRSLLLGEKHTFEACAELARKHVKDNVIFMLDEKPHP
jgi:hypothetical protein